MTVDLARAVVRQLKEAADPERGRHNEGYHPTAMRILGVPVPKTRKILAPLARGLRGESPEKVLDVARSLLDTRVHEARQVAFELVGRRPDVIRGLDASAVEALGEGNDNWGSVDCFAVYVAGPSWRDGKVTDGDVRRWADSDDPWWRRTALVCTVPLNMSSRGGTGDGPRTVAVCELLAVDRHPMVVKALSWALRALVPVEAGVVEAFLARHGEDLAPLVRREVGNKLRTGVKNPRGRG
ncbi:MAG: DNA alkylation repair protein [Gemmatimonadota bacterium]